MIVTDTLLSTLRTNLRTDWQTGFDSATAQVIHDMLATRIPSNTASNSYGWLSQFPKMREWIGDRVFRDVSESSYQITNKLYESTVPVARTDIEDDTLGMYGLISRNAGHETRLHPTRVLANLIKAGNSTLCYDGQNFFDTDHPVYPNEDGTGVAEVQSNYAAGVGPAWYLLDCSRPIKPFIFQERTSPELDAIMSTDNPEVFMRDTYLYGVRYRMNMGFGLYQMAYRSELPLTAENFEAAQTALGQMKRDGGEPMGIMPTHLVVPTALGPTAKKVVEAEYIDGGNSNIHAGTVTPFITPWLN